MKEDSYPTPHMLKSYLYGISRIETESRLAFSRGLVWGEWGVTANGYSGGFWHDKNVLKLNSGDCCTTL